MKRTFPLLCAAGFFGLMAFEWCRTPITPWFARSFQIDESFVGFIMGASTITGIFLKLPGGILSDVIGRKPVLVTSLLFITATPFAYTFADGATALLLVRFLHGGATALFMPVTIAIIADLYPDRKGTAMGWYWAFALSGRSIGHTLSPAFLVMTGAFGTTYMIAGPIGGIGLLLVLAIKSPAKAQPAPPRKKFKDGLREALGNRQVLIAALAGGTLWFATGSLQANLPLYAKEVRGIGEVQIGTLFTALVVVSLVMRPFMGMLSDRIGRKPIIVPGLFLTGALVILIMRTETYGWLLALVACYGLAEAMVQTCATAFVTDVCKPGSTGSALGVFGSLMDICHASGLALTGTLLLAMDRNYGTTFLCIGGGIFLAAVLFLVLVRLPPGKR